MGPPDSHRISRVPRYSGLRYGNEMLRIRGFHPLWRIFPSASARFSSSDIAVLQPRSCIETQQRFGLFPGRSPLLGESLLFSLPTGTKMFQFPAFASIYTDDSPSDCRVFPFGYRGVKAYLRLTHAFRSLSRPSSPVRA